jgi:4-hydroxy-tetrahydrodipicolinate reductase
MKIALIGYGKMGQEIEKIALSRRNEIVLIIDINNQNDFTTENLKLADVAIVFTVPESSVAIFKKCFESGVPVVSGNTGWLNNWNDVVSECNKYNSAFFWTSNFSLGVNVFFELNKTLARLMKPFSQYKASLTEVHHTRKLDAPSGTAISLADDLIKERGIYKGWVNNLPEDESELGIVSVREGDVPGIHTIRYDSDVDFIEITHNAKSRKGFAFGAVLAAEYLEGKHGIFSMKDLLNFDK